jgi:hypothetical protein
MDIKERSMDLEKLFREALKEALKEIIKEEYGDDLRSLIGKVKAKTTTAVEPEIKLDLAKKPAKKGTNWTEEKPHPSWVGYLIHKERKIPVGVREWDLLRYMLPRPNVIVKGDKLAETLNCKPIHIYQLVHYMDRKYTELNLEAPVYKEGDTYRLNLKYNFAKLDKIGGNNELG